MIDPTPGILFQTGAAASAAAASSAVLLGRWADRRRRRSPSRAYLVTGVAALVVAGVVIGAGIYTIAHVREEWRRFTFSYSLALTPNGTGLARVTVPIPVDAELLAGFRISPSSSAAAINESGAEPALDIVLRAPTWVNASYTRILATGEQGYDANLTRTQDAGRSFCERCPSELALAVISGDLRDVRVEQSVSWGQPPCGHSLWTLEATVVPGVREYPGEMSTSVC